MSEEVSPYKMIEGAQCKFCKGPIMRNTWMAPDVIPDGHGNIIKVSDKRIPTDYGTCHWCGFRYTIKEAEELPKEFKGRA